MGVKYTHITVTELKNLDNSSWFRGIYTHTHTCSWAGTCAHMKCRYIWHSITKKLTDRLVEFSRSLEERVHCGLQWYVCMCVGGWLCITSLLSCVCVHTCVHVHARLFVTPWTVVCQAPLSMEFSKQKYWSGLSFPTPRDLPDPGIKPTSPASPELAGDSLPLCCQRSPQFCPKGT